jgi:hypothetical protein
MCWQRPSIVIAIIIIIDDIIIITLSSGPTEESVTLIQLRKALQCIILSLFVERERSGGVGSHSSGDSSSLLE